MLQMSGETISSGGWEVNLTRLFPGDDMRQRFKIFEPDPTVRSMDDALDDLVIGVRSKTRTLQMSDAAEIIKSFRNDSYKTIRVIAGQPIGDEGQRKALIEMGMQEIEYNEPWFRKTEQAIQNGQVDEGMQKEITRFLESRALQQEQKSDQIVGQLQRNRDLHKLGEANLMSAIASGKLDPLRLSGARNAGTREDIKYFQARADILRALQTIIGKQ